MKPYPSYKAANLPWLDTVPEHWAIRRAKGVFIRLDLRSATGKEELLTVSSKHGVIPRRNATVTMFKAESYVGYKLCWPNDLVINSLWAWAGGLGFARHHGIVSSAYGVYRLRPELAAHWLYFDYLLRSTAYDWEFHVRSKGIWTSRLQLTDESFFDMPLLLPPSIEMEAICSFITCIDHFVTRLIRAKRRLIELLNEQKQVISHHAITHGIDPKASLKPSGVEWLGDIPAHWSIRRFKFVNNINRGQVDPRLQPYKSYVLVAPNHIESGTAKQIGEETAEAQGADSGKYVVQEGQVIYSKIRPKLRKVTIAKTQCLCSADMYAISPRSSELRPAYLVLLLLSKPVTKYLVECSMRVAMPKVNREALGNCWLWYPHLSIQDSILHWIEEEAKPLETAIERTRREIDLIREYRTRLISDAVTGKIDVRDIGVAEFDGSAEWDTIDTEAEETDDELDAEEETEDADD